VKRWVLKAGATTGNGLAQEIADMPKPRSGEVRVRLHAVSLSHRDHLILCDSTGAWRPNGSPLPAADGAGVVDALGDGVTEWSVGDRVITVFVRGLPHWPPNDRMGPDLGAPYEVSVLAEYVVLPAERLTRAPANLTFAEASTLPRAAVTAWNGLQLAHPLQSKHKVLMLGTGGISLFAVSMAKALGAEVFVASSHTDKYDRLAALGVARIFDYRNDLLHWGKAIFDTTGGMDKIINTAGPGSMNQAIQALALGGDIAVIGPASFGDTIDPGLLLAKGVSLRGIPAGSRDQQEQVVEFFETHNIKPIIFKTFAFDEAKAAYEAQLSRDLFGKVVIRMVNE
jgi:NADPH:quinone reductase-like Zn-dependent oxidoreductase